MYIWPTAAHLSELLWVNGAIVVLQQQQEGHPLNNWHEWQVQPSLPDQQLRMKSANPQLWMNMPFNQCCCKSSRHNMVVTSAWQIS
jgi:hypothetical protein